MKPVETPLVGAFPLNDKGETQGGMSYFQWLFGMALQGAMARNEDAGCAVDDAVAALEYARERHPEFFVDHVALSKVYAMKKYHQETSEAFKKAIA